MKSIFLFELKYTRDIKGVDMRRIGVVEWSHLICNFDCVDKNKHHQYHSNDIETRMSHWLKWESIVLPCVKYMRSLGHTATLYDMVGTVCAAFVIYECLCNSIYCYICHGFLFTICCCFFYLVVSIKMIRMNLKILPNNGGLNEKLVDFTNEFTTAVDR